MLQKILLMFGMESKIMSTMEGNTNNEADEVSKLINLVKIKAGEVQD